MILIGALTAILGFAIIVWPGATLNIGLLFIGALCIIAGALGLVATFDVDRKTSILCLILAVFGIALIAIPHFMAELSAYVFALFLILIGISQIFENGIPISDKSALSMAIGAIFVLFGVIIAIFPEETITTTLYIFGAILVISGILLAFNGWKCKTNCL